MRPRARRRCDSFRCAALSALKAIPQRRSEDANTAYGYLTWMSARSNWVPIFPPKLAEVVDACQPAALWNEYPHEPSGAPDCRYGAVAGCEQRFDVGVLS